MDAAKKSALIAELLGLKVMMNAATPTGTLHQGTFPVNGTTVTIPHLPSMAFALQQQNDCMLKLAGLLQKVIEAS